MTIDSIEPVAGGQWLALSRIHYTDDEGVKRTWETVTRQRSFGAVIMLAKLMPSRRWIIVRQFRPPVGGYSIEFPAGLIEPGEAPDSAAVRELREETGYNGRVVKVLQKAYNSPGLTSEYVVFVQMEVYEAAQGELVTDFDESENIQTFTVPADGLRAFLDGRTAAGDFIDAKLLACAIS